MTEICVWRRRCAPAFLARLGWQAGLNSFGSPISESTMSETNQRAAFERHLLADNREGSGKASSYLRALDLLSGMLEVRDFGFRDCIPIWSVDSLERLEELRGVVAEQTRESERSPWNRDEFPKSYLRDGYCRAALRAYQEFLLENAHEREVWQDLEVQEPAGEGYGNCPDRPVQIPNFLLADWAHPEGKTAQREIETRINQNVFRRIILKVYQNCCCLTGLDIPEVNRASHILSWASCRKSRMDPHNGLCLSATYDAAFDRHLISLDPDYRLILSKDLKDHYNSEAVQHWFHQREGERITMPVRFIPSQTFLEQHRELGRF